MYAVSPHILCHVRSNIIYIYICEILLMICNYVSIYSIPFFRCKNANSEKKKNLGHQIYFFVAVSPIVYISELRQFSPLIPLLVGPTRPTEDSNAAICIIAVACWPHQIYRGQQRSHLHYSSGCRDNWLHRRRSTTSRECNFGALSKSALRLMAFVLFWS